VKSRNGRGAGAEKKMIATGTAEGGERYREKKREGRDV